MVHVNQVQANKSEPEANFMLNCTTIIKDKFLAEEDDMKENDPLSTYANVNK